MKWKSGQIGVGLRKTLLIREVIPLFYKVDDYGTPYDWAHVMKKTIKIAGPVFSSKRMAQEYCGKYYQKALKSVPKPS
jgi:glucan phosphorylase